MLTFLWSLKLGAVFNLWLLCLTLSSEFSTVTPHVLLPAQVFFAVSAYRCLFPVRYKNNIVFHDTVFSSIFLTRILATFSELALIYQLANLVRNLNFTHKEWLNALSWLMVALVLISQIFVWKAILTQKLKLFFYEEMGWTMIYLINTLISIYLYATNSFPIPMKFLVHINIIFGFIYLPWQFFRLRELGSNNQVTEVNLTSKELIKIGLERSIRKRNPSSDFRSWGGWTGMVWMTAYWASLLPSWVFLILSYFKSH